MQAQQRVGRHDLVSSSAAANTVVLLSRTMACRRPSEKKKRSLANCTAMGCMSTPYKHFQEKQLSHSRRYRAQRRSYGLSASARAIPLSRLQPPLPLAAA